MHLIIARRHVVLSFTFLICIQLSAQEKFREVNFDNQFKKENQGKVKIEINELKELIHIMIALTDSGLENDDMVAQNTDYYKDVLVNFKPYKNEKIIIKFDSLIKANPLNYIFLTGNALSYHFKNNQLAPDRTYIFPAQTVSSHTTITTNIISSYKKEIEDFAVKTNFRAFYNKNRNYYNTIISDYIRLANLQEQWNWLEKNFYARMDNYTIMCSPLINGLNYTTSYTDNNFKQIMMVLPPVDRSFKLTEKQNMVFNTRIMFTEIDHNYVGKPSEKYVNHINIALKDRDKWIDSKKPGAEYYPNPLRIFDEYMTYAAFYLYCNDKFSDDPETINYAYKDVNAVMIDRGFPKIKEFNDELLRLHTMNKDKKIDDLYPAVLAWCQNQ